MKQVGVITNNRFKVTVSTDEEKLKLFCELEPLPEILNAPLTVQELTELIEAKAKTYDLDGGVLDDIVRHANAEEVVAARRIKKGKGSVDGVDGRVVFLVKRFEPKPDSNDEAHQKNLKSLHLFDNVRKGAVLARIYPPKIGTPGLDVFGKIINPKPGKVATLQLDASVSKRNATQGELSFEEVVAESDGFIPAGDNKVKVADILIVDGNLDYRFGNIDFVGAVSIGGDVSPGFSVRSEKGIVIKGSVREAQLLCTSGEINIGGLYFGGREGSISAGGRITLGSVQEAAIESEDLIIVNKGSVNSHLRSQIGIVVKGGAVIGGSLQSVKGAEIAEVGNEAGINTTITFLTDAEAKPEYRKLMTQIATHERAKHLLKLHLGTFASDSSKIEKLAEPYKTQTKEMVQKLRKLEVSMATLLNEKKRLIEGSKADDAPRVCISKTLYPGVKIMGREQEFASSEKIAGPINITLQETFNVGPYEPLNLEGIGTEDNKKLKESKTKK